MSRLWLLVEWIEEKNIFPSYGVVSVGSLVGSDTNLHVKKVIFVRDKHGHSTKRAEILRISDNKQYIKEQKALLEKDDHNVKNMLSLCMKTLMDMKSNSSKYQDQSSSGQQSPASNQSLSNLPVVVAETDHSSSESELEPNHRRNARKRHRQPDSMKIYKNKRIESLSSRRSTPSPNQNIKINHRHSTSCSTPIIPKPKIMYDQGTQTEPMKDVKKLECLVLTLYQQFNSLVEMSKEERRMKEENTLSQYDDENQCNQIEHYNIEQLQINQNDQYNNHNMNNQIEQYNNDGTNNQVDHYEFNGSVVTQVINSNFDQNGNDFIPIYAEVPEENMLEVMKDVKTNIETPTAIEPAEEAPVDEKNVSRVKKVEAHTTGDDLYDKMVPIGRGYAKVPARLLNDIDWTSCTGATRQLMQALFPRKTLATHSLTGKQSPAFADKPAKKRLDPNIVNDIVETVYLKCGNVSKRMVRACISTKCTDEAKLYRNRCNQNLDKKQKKADQENLPPTAAASPYSDCSV